VVMLGLMYLTIYSLEHVYWSETRANMALFMGATMAIIVLLFMIGMYPNTRLNAGILAGGAAVFALAHYLARSRETVGDVALMRVMIPHHLIAILTSERAHISDPQVRKLADQIIEAQWRKIGEMTWLIAELGDKK